MEEVWFLDRRGAANKGEIGAEAMFGGVDSDSQGVQGFKNLDLDWADDVRFRSVEWRPARCVDVDLFGLDRSAVDYNAEVCVRHVTIWIQPEGGSKEQPSVTCVAVEEVPVVVIEVGSRRLGDGM